MACSLIEPEIQVYPNPAKDNATLELNGFSGQASQFRVLKTTGESVRSFLLQYVDRKTQQLDFTGLDSGVYVIEVQSGKTRMTKRIILLK